MSLGQALSSLWHRGGVNAIRRSVNNDLREQNMDGFAIRMGHVRGAWDWSSIDIGVLQNRGTPQ